MTDTFSLVCKAAGILSIFAAWGGGIYLMLLRDRARLYRLDCLIALVKYIKQQIDRYLTPLSEIFARCDREVFDGCFTGCPPPDGSRPADVEQLAQALKNGEYAADGAEALSLFASGLGRGYREEEVRSCEICIDALTAVRTRLGTELPRRRRSAATLGFCAAAALVIFML